MKRILLLNVLIILISLPLLSQKSKKDSQQLFVIETSMGEIEVLLYNDTPLHRDNMVKLIQENFYNGQLFHRVIDNFMIQGGDPASKNAASQQSLGNGGPDYTVPAEFRANHFHKKGALAAARTGDDINPQRASSGSQFYIVEGNVLTTDQLTSLQSTGRHKAFTPEEIEAYTSIGGTPHLDGAYTVFGEVTKGMEVIDAISVVATDRNNRPVADVVFKMRLK